MNLSETTAALFLPRAIWLTTASFDADRSLEEQADLRAEAILLCAQIAND